MFWIFWKYVDDIFMAIPRNAEQLVLDAFNRIEPRIQFTIETEEDRRLPFLDMTVVRNPDQTLTTEWYAKPIASGRLLNYKSFHEPKHKINVANNFIHRVFSLTRNKPEQEMAATIHRHLLMNNYPKQLISRLINLYTNKRQKVEQRTEGPSQPPNETGTEPAPSTECTHNQPPQLPPTVPTNHPPHQQIPTTPAPDPLHTTSNPIEHTQSQPSCQPPSQHPTQPAIMPAVPIPLIQPHRPQQQTPTMPPPDLQHTTPNQIERTQSQPSCQPPSQHPTQPAIMPAASPIPYTQPHQRIDHANEAINSCHSQANSSSIDHQATSSYHVNGQRNTHPDPEQPTIQKEEKMFRSIPYIPALSERIRKLLAKDFPNISVATKQHRTVYDLHTKVKHPVSKNEISNVIYKIPCNDCDSCYVGMTRNNLRKRLAGHRSNVNKLEKLKHDNNHNTTAAKATLIETTTALIQHSIENDHTFNLEDTQIIDHSNKPSTLPFLEMCHITNTNHTVNKRTDIDRLSTTYAAVLHSIKNIKNPNTSRVQQNADTI